MRLSYQTSKDITPLCGFVTYKIANSRQQAGQSLHATSGKSSLGKAEKQLTEIIKY